MSVSNILDQLATTSSRPRYAFAVLALLAEQAGPTGKTGPFITDEDEEKLPLREYIGKRLARMSGRDSRRRQLESRIREDLKDVLPEDMFEAQRIVDEKVHARVRATGADHFSRVVGELEKCGYIARYYEGYRTPHSNQIGLRNLVCVLDPDVSIGRAHV